MKNNKLVISKILSIMLLLFVLIGLSSFKQIKESTKITSSNKQAFLTNDHFDPSLTGASDAEVAEEYITMTALYEGIKARIEAVANSSDEAKQSKDNEIANWITLFVGNKRISISTSLELYKFGNAQSINFESQGGTNTFIFRNTITKVLSLNYVLLNDIDYSTMKAQKFVPIGTKIFIEQGSQANNIDEYFPFMGTFDGNSFEIKNLYLADYQYISTTFTGEDESTAITISTTQNYAMFANIGSTGIIKNFILRNPSYELIVMDDSAGIFKFSSLAGDNKGLIYNVGVIDKRLNSQNEDNSGISFTMLYPTTIMATAGGFVHTNSGTIQNSYYTSLHIIVSNSLFRFSEVAPFVHTNTGTIEGALYEANTTTKPSNFNPSSIVSYSEANIKNENLHLNSAITSDTIKWHFYPNDGYPQLIGLEYIDGEYIINNAYDFLIFSKLVNLETVVNGKKFDEHTYVLKKDINMINYQGYKTPSKEFKGLLKGGDSDFTLGSTTNNNKYIYNLNISSPYIIGNNYYLGLFSILSGTVKNINIYQSQINIIDSSPHYGKTFYIGMVAGEIRGGTIKNIVNDGDIYLGEKAIGSTYAGGIVGIGNGTISFVANTGNIDAGIHDFNNKTITANYYIGGLIGRNNGNITISYSQNGGNIIGLSALNNNYNVANKVQSFTGGIIGEVNNINKTTASLKYLSNYGIIDAGSFIGKTPTAELYVGGIFASLRGYGFQLNDGSAVKNGALENSGLIKGTYINQYTYLYAAGIGVANTSEAYAKISYMSNNEGFDITNFNYQNHNKYIYYAATIIDNSSSGVELSRAYNYQDYNFGVSYFTTIGLSNPDQIMVSPFFTSVLHASSKLNYVENKGKLRVGSTDADIVVSRLLKVSNITQATKVDYQNVINSGDIEVLRINNTNDSIYVAGIAWILPYINRSYLMNNVVNQGNIYTAGILGNTTISGTVTGTSFADRTFNANLNVRNLYVAGIVNINVGEIVNVFNLGNITSKYNQSLYDILGTANSFIGGIATFNYNLIQDAANSGLIEYTNSSINSVSYFAATTNVSTTNNSTFGGISIAYTGGVVIGGIVGALGDVAGTELNGYVSAFPANKAANVIDIANNGDIYGKAKEYVRSGGVLGIALSVELASGTYENRSDKDNITAGPFTKAEIGAEDPVGKSKLSNGLNYGNIYAITQTIGSYGTSFGTGSNNNNANAMRPGINSSAGGVIAYGLTEMVRMLNHGVVSSTDVAGGVVGATYILGGASQASTPITTVKINTAVHYGKIKAIKKDYYSSFTYNASENFNNTNKYYEDGNTSFIFEGTGSYDKARYQNGRRGFGGIFGRLQRGNYGTMSSTEFNNILNMDSNIDMVGRVDSNLPGSLVYYRFFTGEDTYYTAKTNDTTPNSLVGWYQTKYEDFVFSNAQVKFEVNRAGSGTNWDPYVYYITKIDVTSENGFAITIRGNKTVMRPNATSVSTAAYSYSRPMNSIVYQGTSTSSPYRIADFGLTSGTGNQDVKTNGSFPQTVTKTNYSRTITMLSATGGNTSNPGTGENLRYPVLKVSDNESDTSGLYIFDPSFPLMAAVNSEYIYAVNEDSLAERFQREGRAPDEYSMYVLASSTGSLDGATLPTNIKINNLLRLDEEHFKYIDLDNVSTTDKIFDDDYAEKIIEDYKSMYQLSYNTKAEILAEDVSASPLIAELTLYDPRVNGKSPLLTKGTIDHSTKTITYTLSDSAFAENAFYYEVMSNVLSNNAIIAKDNIVSTDLASFREDYKNRVDNILASDSNFKFSISGTILTGQTVEFKIKIYSEINIMDNNVFENKRYVEEYTIKIVRQNQAINTNATITLDDSTNITANSISADYTVNLNTYSISPKGNIDVSFIGTNSTINNLIPLNHKMSVHNVYLVEGSVETKINEQFYDITINAKGSTNYFGFNVSFSDLLQAGTYKIEYSYYENSQIRSIKVAKRSSTSFDIVDVNYDYFSNDLLGEEFEFIQTDASEFMTYSLFSNDFIGVGKTNLSLTSDLKQSENNEFTYTDDIYYDLLLNNNKLLSVRIAPFARLTNALIHYEYVEGKRLYILTYTIQNEALNSTTITHKILERDLDEMIIYLDDNYQPTNYFTITREADLSKIGIDFNFIDNSLYNNVNFVVEDASGEFLYTNEEIYEGVHSNNFILYISGKLEKGLKTYTFNLEREEGVFYNLGFIDIEKLLGNSAYLQDIKFTLDDSEVLFEYPVIKASNALGIVDNNYDPRIYADGIDYGSSIDDNVLYFRIDGKVADIILEDYSPRFYLPYGAKIERFSSSTNSWVLSLNDDFAGSDDDVEKIVKYRVTSEDSLHQVIYFITAKDIRYNLTLRFKIYYEFADGSLVDASNANSPIKDSYVLISLKNLKLDSVYLTTGPTVNDFPIGINKDTILGINNQSSLYYFTSADTSIVYRFGRNSTGAYNFNVVTPLYTGVKTDKLTPGERYQYEIYIMPRGVDEWKTSNYFLPSMSSIATGFSGAYYFVSSTTPNPITRELAIIIKAETREEKWGLYNEYASWD